MEVTASLTRATNHFPEKQTSLSVASSSTNDDCSVASLNPMALAVRNEWRTASHKSWAQQTEESYQLQLALALRLSSEATCADDPHFLDPGTDERTMRSSSDSVEVVSHRFWVNGSLSYNDKVPDGFYLIHGMDPYVWSMSADIQETGRVPSFESLKAVDPCDGLSIEVVLFDKSRDTGLKELKNRVLSLSSGWITRKEVVVHLAELVCNHMGGVASTEECFGDQWKECTKVLKDCLRSIVLPIGSLSIGLCVHRALLFKVLADVVNLPCRITKGCKYCGRRDFTSSCLVRFGLDREYLVDLIGRPGVLCQPDSVLNGQSTILVASPLCHPRFRTVEAGENFGALAKLYFSEGQSVNIAFDDAPAGTAIEQDDSTEFCKPYRMIPIGRNYVLPISSSDCESSISALPQKTARPITDVGDLQMQSSCNPFLNVICSTHLAKGSIPPSHLLPMGHRDAQQILVISGKRPDTMNKKRLMEAAQKLSSKPSHESSFMGDLDIPWSDLDLKEKIGSGSFGTVHRAEWHGFDVAVKILTEEDFPVERFREFLNEVSIMKRLWHPNIVLFLGAVTHPPNLSIVTEYLSRGSLYKLLHDGGVMLDDTCRLNMAYDVAKGMNHLHQLKPPIVHLDLKSPNLLVDDEYTVKVCDFGLSRSKANTFLSSKTAGGTPEWMAPEVLRNEPSDEKSDVYSFGVILWELVTLQRPWRNFNTSQVVAAVGFMGKRLEIPSKVNPQVAALIEACWANEPRKRPTFSFITEFLQQLILYSTHQPFCGNVLHL